MTCNVNAQTSDSAGTAILSGVKTKADMISMVFQHFNRFDELTAFTNAAMQAHWAKRSERSTMDQRTRELPGRLGIRQHDALCAMMSGGEQKRVA